MAPSACTCGGRHVPRLVVVTGGPGAGKTALLETVRRHFCRHVAVLPESASIVFGGGFPRGSSDAQRRAGQRAIFRVQRELEQLTVEERWAVGLCDRGTVDGAAYWPGDPDSFFAALGTTREAELARYRAVIQLRTPPPGEYNHRNPLRTESVEEAARIDERIAAAWRGHPRIHVVPHTHKFIEKVERALDLIRAEIPDCCMKR